MAGGDTEIGDLPLPAGTVVDGRYRVLSEIGAGGMGRVYAAEHMFLRRRIALKLLRRGPATTPEAAARLVQEATLAGQVPHPAVVRVFDCAVLGDGQVYLAMELLRGESLETALRRPGGAAQVVPLLAEVARGLAAVHRVGVVHRDVKPANIFLAQAAGGVQAKLLDFGVAKLLPGAAGAGDDAVQTQAGAVLGTPYYLAPEQARGGEIDGRADLYSLGVILYEALTGGLPFVGDSFMAILAQHVRSAPLDPRQAAPGRAIPDGLARLTMRLLAKEPTARVRDGDALADELEALWIAEGPLLARAADSGGLAEVGTQRVADSGALAAMGTQRVGDGGALAQMGTQRLEESAAALAAMGTQRLEESAAALAIRGERGGEARLVEGTGRAGLLDMSSRSGTGAAAVVVVAPVRSRGPIVLGVGLAAIASAAIGWAVVRAVRQAPVVEQGGVERTVVEPGRAEHAVEPAAPESVVGEGPAEPGAGGVEVAPAGPTGEVAPVGPATVTPVDPPAPGTVAAPEPARAGDRPGKKRPRGGGTTRTPRPPTVGGDPPLKPDVYDE